MRLLVVNSNTTRSVTELVAAEARRACAPDTEVCTVTAPFGVPAIQDRASVTEAAHATLAAFREHGANVDAGVVACFSDPGVEAIREEAGFPVVGIAEAACLTACMLGRRFTILAVGPTLVPGIHELVSHYGLTDRLAGVRAIEHGVLDAVGDQKGTRDKLRRQAREAVTEDGAQALVLGGAVTAGMAPTIAAVTSVPVLDGISCAVRQAELLVSLRG